MNVKLQYLETYRSDLINQYGSARVENTHADVLINMSPTLHKQLFPRGLQFASNKSLLVVAILTHIELLKLDGHVVTPLG